MPPVQTDYSGEHRPAPEPSGPSAERFFLGQDSSSHWYIVPVSRTEDWLAWRDLDEDDERAWTAPDYARAVGGSPFLVTFADPKIE